MILLVINSPSTCFGRLYAHHQEVRLRFHCLSFSVLLSNITTATTGQKMIGSENAAWPPDDGRKDARNMLRDYWLPIESLIVASSWSHLYLLTKICRENSRFIEIWNNNAYFTFRHLYLYDSNSPNFSYNEKYFTRNLYFAIRTNISCSTTCSRKWCRLWCDVKNKVQTDRSQMTIRRMLLSC